MTKVFISSDGAGDSIFTHASGAADGPLMLSRQFSASGAAGIAVMSGVSVGAGTQLWVSGIPVGDRLYTTSQITSSAETFIEGGTADPVSGVNVGAATQLYLSGVRLGDHFRADGLGVSGTYVGAGLQVYVSGIPMGDFLQPIGAPAEAFVEGGTADPSSGVNVGAATQLYLSGVRLGDHFRADGLGVSGAYIGAGTQTYLSGVALGNHFKADGSTVSGTYIGAGTQVYVSGISVGDYLSASASVDLSAVAQDVIPDASGVRSLGSFQKPWLRGYFDTIRLFDNNGMQWTLAVNTSGTLTIIQSPGV